MPLPLTILAPVVLAGLIWAYVFFKRAGLIGGLLVTILAGSCFGHPFFNWSAVTIDRLLLAVVVSLYFAQRAFLGLRSRSITKSDIVLTSFIACLVGSTFAHNWRYDGGQPVAFLLFFYLMPFAMYWVGSRCEITERAHHWILGVFAGFGAYLSLTAVCEVLGQYSIVFPRYISSPEVLEFFGRARGPFLNPIGNGMYLTAALIATLMCWPFVQPRYRRAVAGLAALICLGAFCTLTRSVWLGAGVATLGMAIAVVPKAHRFRVILLAGIAGGLFFSLAGDRLVAFKRDKYLTSKETAESAKLRPILAAFAYEMFRDQPLTGVGLRQYQRHNIEYLTARSFDVPMNKGKEYVQHNVFLSLLVETGLVGLTLFVLVLGIWMVNGWRLWNDCELPLWRRQLGLFTLLLIAAYVANGMFHEMSLIPKLNWLIFLLAGFSRNAHEPSPAARESRLPQRSLRTSPSPSPG